MNLLSVAPFIAKTIIKGLPCGGIPGVVFIVWVGEVNLIRKTQTNKDTFESKIPIWSIK